MSKRPDAPEDDGGSPTALADTIAETDDSETWAAHRIRGDLGWFGLDVQCGKAVFNGHRQK